jgi:hypothetical protein
MAGKSPVKFLVSRVSRRPGRGKAAGGGTAARAYRKDPKCHRGPRALAGSWGIHILLGVVAVLIGLGVAAFIKTGRETRLSGSVRDGQGRPLGGIILVEKGRLYGRDYLYGGRMSDRGRFSIKVPEGGSYAVHLYATGHMCHSESVTVMTGRINRFSFTLVANSEEADSPQILEVRFTPTEDGKRVTMGLTVNDPNNDLSHQVLGLNLKTQQVFIFSPPAPVAPGFQDYPNGLYTFQYIAAARPFDEKDWVFVAADNRSYNSPVLGYPFTVEGVIPAAGAGGPAPVSPGRAQDRPLPEFGEKIF